MVSIQERLKLLEIVLGKSTKTTGLNYLFNCPFCHHHKPKLQIHLELGQWRCWVCPEKGKTFNSLLRKVNAPKEIKNKFSGRTNFKVKIESSTSIPISLPKEYIPLYKSSSDIDFKHAIAYIIKKRNLTLYDVLRYRLGYCKEGRYAGTIIFPSYDEGFNLNFFTARSYYDAGAKHLAPPFKKDIIGFESMINWNVPITLVEGPIDAIATKTNVIPLFGKFPSKKLKEKLLSSQVTDVYLALDADAIEMNMILAEELINNGKSVYRIELPPGSDPGSLGYSKMQELKSVAKKLTLGDILKFKLKL